jgi:hypothetical protein
LQGFSKNGVRILALKEWHFRPFQRSGGANDGMSYQKDSLFGRPSAQGERGGPPFANRTTDHFDQELRELPSVHANTRPIDPARRTKIALHYAGSPPRFASPTLNSTNRPASRHLFFDLAS